MLEHVVEVVALHDHVVEFKEGQTLLHPLFVALGAQHVVDAEAGAHLAQQFHIVQVQQPVGVVEHHRLALTEFDEPLHLALEAFGIVGDVFLGQHLAHVGAAGRVTDQRGSAADQGDGLVAGHLQPLHQGQGHEVAGGQAVGRAVKADVKGGLAAVDDFPDLLLIRHLRNQAAGFQFFVDLHRGSSLVGGKGQNKTPPAKCKIWQRARNTRYHLCSPAPHGGGPSRVRAADATSDTQAL